jgi:hypothetical protein
MLVLVTVADADTATGLIERLVGEVDAELVSFEPEQRQVCVELKREPDRNLGRILNAVESWLGDGGRSPAKVEIDGHSYTLGARAVGGVA